MKKMYTPPSVEVVKFEYKDQVVAASSGCIYQRGNTLYDVISGCDEIINQNNEL